MSSSHADHVFIRIFVCVFASTKAHFQFIKVIFLVMLLGSCLRLSRRIWTTPFIETTSQRLPFIRPPFGLISAKILPSKLRLLPALDQIHAKKYVTHSNQEAKENIFTIPNGLCVFRIAATPYLAHLILQNDLDFAFGLFALAGFTDLVISNAAAYSAIGVILT